VPKLRFNVGNLDQTGDARVMPAYSIAAAARYLQLPAATLRSWVCGRTYRLKDGTERRFRQLISLPEKGVALLSFFNLAEAHVLSALRREHEISMPHIRSALNFVGNRYGWKRPLLEQLFRTDGVGLFIEQYGRLIEASAAGQQVMREIIDAHLQRLEWEHMTVARLYPFTRPRDLHGPRSVVIDPRYSFGRPVLVTSHISTEVIFERYQAGESPEELAEDYGCETLDINEAIRCESRREAA
jgi:uncharacterized protein (DUF433 family)